jgi:peptide/nickel transport system permease protein
MSTANRGYVLRRLLFLAPMLVGLSVVVFALIHLAPGDPALALVSEQSADPTIVAQVRENLGLNEPLPVQYAIWASKVARLDFGTAYTFNRKPVIDLIGERVEATLVLQALSLGVALAIALPVGIVSAKRYRSSFDQTTTAGSFLGLALPDFWVALLLQLLFAVSLGWLPASTSGGDTSGLDRARYAIMPVAVLAFPTAAVLVRYVRSSMLEVINQDYITTARAKGLADQAVTYRHALKNAILPMVTVIGTQAARLLSGAVVVEYVFSWPGLGSLAYESILRRDYPVILALTLLTGAFVLLLNVLVDALYAVLDPRIAFD